MEAEIRVTPDGKQILVVTEYDEHGPIEHGIPFAAIASWRELLGIEDIEEVLTAILHVAEHGEPDPDPVTGENAWTEPYGLLVARENAREDEAAKALDEGADLSLAVERGNKAAHDAVHAPAKDGECDIDKCRKKARQKLGIPDPSRKCGPETRHTPPTIPGQDVADPVARAVGLLKDKTPELQECTRRFLHGLTDRETDPLEDRSNDD